MKKIICFILIVLFMLTALLACTSGEGESAPGTSSPGGGVSSLPEVTDDPSDGASDTGPDSSSGITPDISTGDTSDISADDMSDTDASGTSSDVTDTSDISADDMSDTDASGTSSDVTDTSEPPDTDEGYEVNGLLISGTMGMEMFYGSTSCAESYSAVLGKFRSRLSDDIRIYSLVVPHASSYYAPSNYSYLLDYGKRAFDTLTANLPDGVIYVDVYNTLKEHLDEPIYPRTEHHWNALGAFYAAREMCSLAGISLPGLEQFEKQTQSGFVGSLYTFCKADVLKNNPEDFVFYVPTNTYTAKFYNKGNYDLSSPNMTRSSCLFDLSGSTSGKYATFLAADDYFVHIETGNSSGRNLVIFKDSYGNALAPFYAASGFDNIYFCDIRTFALNGPEFAESVGATDVMFAVSGFTACGPVYSYIEGLLS